MEYPGIAVEWGFQEECSPVGGQAGSQTFVESLSSVSEWQAVRALMPAWSPGWPG